MLRPDFRAGLCLTDVGGVAPDELLESISTIAQTAESSGFDALFIADHFQGVMASDEPVAEGTMTLAALAARTERAHLGLLVGGVTHRNPAVLAKLTTTLDVLSGGRAILGLGTAWADQEHAAYGLDFPSMRERYERLEDALQIARAMFTDPAASFAGTHHRIERAHNVPQPIRGDIPIMIGGNGERKTLRLVAQYADACNLTGDVATLRHLVGVLERHCEDLGRDPAQITRTSYETVVIADTPKAAAHKLAALRDASPAGVYDEVIAGGPEEVTSQAAERRDAGIDALIVGIPDEHDLAAVALAGRAVSAAMA
jgi:F420-dependent oxidoreductase-like protein